MCQQRAQKAKHLALSKHFMRAVEVPHVFQHTLFITFKILCLNICLSLIRGQLLAGDFTTNMRLLQVSAHTTSLSQTNSLGLLESRSF